MLEVFRELVSVIKGKLLYCINAKKNGVNDQKPLQQLRADVCSLHL